MKKTKRNQPQTSLYMLNNDCKKCFRNEVEKSPFIQDLYQAKGYTLVSVKGSIPYLLRMTDIIELGINNTFEEQAHDEQKCIFSDYFSDIKTILGMFAKMRDNV